MLNLNDITFNKRLGSLKSLEVEYALQGMTKPIGVSEFTGYQALPAELKSTLPTMEEFENELNKTIE